MPKKKDYCLNLVSVDNKLHTAKWNFHHCSAFFYLQLGLVGTKILCCVEQTPQKGFNSFVQSAVDSRGQDKENPNCSGVAETKKTLRNSSYGYQISDCNRHTVPNYLSDEKTHAAITSKLFKKLDHVNNSLYEVEVAKAKIEHKEPIIV